MELNEAQEALARKDGLLIEQCTDGTFRWESMSGSGHDCATEEEAYEEFFAHMVRN